MSRLIVACLLLSLPLALVAEEGFALLSTDHEQGIRLKELVQIKGVRDNQLHGVGLVVGLSGTGDKSEATVRMIRNFLASSNLQFGEDDLESKNVAMVVVTADLPVFAKEGSELPVQVSCIGDARSLQGGTLVTTPLVAADRNIYAVAAGPVSIGGFGVAQHAELGDPGIDHQRHPTVGALTAIVEREVPAKLLYGDKLVLNLKEPDFTTAHKITQALAEVFDPSRIEAKDASQIVIGFAERPTDGMLVEAIARLEHLRVLPDGKAKVVINTKTGTVVVGHEVRIHRAAVSHGGLSLKVLPQTRRIVDAEDPDRVQEKRVWIDPVTREVSETPPPGIGQIPNHGTMTVVEAATVEDIANALNAMGARPKDLVAIFQALHRAGALHAELVVL